MHHFTSPPTQTIRTKTAKDVGELKRVVNGLLQAIDSFFSTESLIIAASNHQYLLDPALWRRFDDLIFLPEPGLQQRLTLLKRLLNGVNYTGSLDSLAKKTAGLSFAAIERCVVESVKTMIMADREELRPQDVQDQIKRHKETVQAAKKKSGKSVNE